MDWVWFGRAPPVVETVSTLSQWFGFGTALGDDVGPTSSISV